MSSGRVLLPGLDVTALHRPKRLFGAARTCEEGGSLTIVATAMAGTDSKLDQAILDEFKNRGNSEVVLDRERNPKIPDDHVVEAELHMKGPNLFGREAARTFEAAADLLVDKLERQVERLRDKKVREPRRRAQASSSEPVPVEEIEQELRPTNG